MHRKQHNEPLSVEVFYMPFVCTLNPHNRWVIYSSLMPWEELEEVYVLADRQKIKKSCERMTLTKFGRAVAGSSS